ncbi:unnamed protein product, partial [Thelazia callipaeda]|uniref:KIF1B domain-containing protein n=1 Tax=Thelazia callipaeda TaxID=103827 RepID=A0A0N5CYA6_THECL
RERKFPRAVEFADPIHQLFSSSSNTVEETTGSSIFDEGELIEDISAICANYEQLNVQVRLRKPYFSTASNELYVVEILIGNLQIDDSSLLLDSLCDDYFAHIEWKFLDFPLSECETPRKPLPLPRNSQSTATFNFRKCKKKLSKMSSMNSVFQRPAIQSKMHSLKSIDLMFYPILRFTHHDRQNFHYKFVL